MDYIKKLITIYNNWGDQNNLQPLSSADEELMFRSNLSDKQTSWLEKFIKVWDKAQNLESKKTQIKI